MGGRDGALQQIPGGMSSTPCSTTPVLHNCKAKLCHLPVGKVWQQGAPTAMRKTRHSGNAEIEAKTPGWWSTSSSWCLSSPRHRGTVVVCDDAQRENFSQVVNDDAKEKRGRWVRKKDKLSQKLSFISKTKMCQNPLEKKKKKKMAKTPPKKKKKKKKKK